MKLTELNISTNKQALTLEQELKELQDRFDNIKSQLNEDLSFPDYSAADPDMLAKMLEDTMKRMDAARRGLGLANKLTGPTKKKHLSRIMSNMNRIRANIRKAEKIIMMSSMDSK